MTPLALAIDDDPLLLSNLAQRLQLIGHTVETADSVEEARNALRRGQSFDYVLLDLELPIDQGSLPDKQHGLNLLGFINQHDTHLPVVVMTAHDHDSSDLSAEVMRHGRAIDYLRKPFPSPPSRHQTLESAVRQAYQRRREHYQHVDQSTRPFQGGRLEFFPDRVEFLGVAICGDEDSGMMRRILDLLHGHGSAHGWRWMTGAVIADRVGAADAGSVASTIGSFRKRITHLLLEKRRVTCPGDAVIRSGKAGYALGDLIDPGGSVEEGPHGRAEEKPVEYGAQAEGLNERQRAILGRLQAGDRLRNRVLQDDLGISERTVKRDMAVLRKLGRARFDGVGLLGVWVLADTKA